jgi:serine/threonine-protein kinase
MKARVTGDIEAMLLAALEKDPARRYQTAEQFSDDLSRWMDGRPIAARRASLGYRVRRFVARHRMEVGIAAVALLSLIGGVISTSLQARRANLERAKMEQINEFLAGMLSAADIDSRGPDVTVAEMLGVAARDIRTASLEPEVEAQLRHTLAQTYTGLGMLDSAAVHASRAYELRQDVFGPADTLTGMSLSYVIRVAEMRGEFATAESLATVLVARYKASRNPSPSFLSIALNNHARILSTLGRLDEALALEKESIGWARQVTDSAGLANLPYSLTNLAIALLYHGEAVQAESLQREALEVEGTHHSRTTNAYGELLQGLGVILEEQGRIPAADSALAEAVPILRARGGDTHTAYLRALGIQARLRLAGGHYEDALGKGNEIMGHVGSAMPEADVNVPMILQTIAAAHDSLGAPADAESALVRSLELRRKYLPEGHWAIGASEALLGRHYLHVGRFRDAERLMTKGYQQIVEGRGEEASISRLTAEHLARLYDRTNRPAEAAAWKSKAGKA